MQPSQQPAGHEGLLFSEHWQASRLYCVTWTAGVWSSGAGGLTCCLQEVCDFFWSRVLSFRWRSQGQTYFQAGIVAGCLTTSHALVLYIAWVFALPYSCLGMLCVVLTSCNFAYNSTCSSSMQLIIQISSKLPLLGYGALMIMITKVSGITS